MYCKNCGKEQRETAKFCAHCGNSHSDTISNSSERKTMSVSEYMSYTNIKSVKEAKQYLWTLRILFLLVGLLGLLSRGLLESESTQDLGALIFVFVHLPITIFFVVFCVKTIKAEKISRAEAMFSIIFAPISWFWFYPAITEPLKIIAGKKQPPISLPEFLTNEEQIKLRADKDKRFWKIVKKVVLVSLFLIIIMVVGLLYSGDSSTSSNSSNSDTLKFHALEKKDYKFTSIAQNFTAIFPNQPSRTEEQVSSDVVGEITATTYSSTEGDITYVVTVGDYPNSKIKIGEDSSEFSVQGGLEGALNGMLNISENTELLSSEKVTFQNNQALKYSLISDGWHADGMFVFIGERLFNIFVTYETVDPQVSFKLDKFIKSFTFTN